MLDVKQVTREWLIGTVTCHTKPESLGVSLAQPGQFVTRKVGQFTVSYEPHGVVCSPDGNFVVCSNDGSETSLYRSDGHVLFKP
jgi:hypothetical protein